MKKILSLFVVFALLLGFTNVVVAKASNENNKKVNVCHMEGDTGRFHMINVSMNALPAHMAHDDELPGTGMLRDDCSLKELQLVESVIVPATSYTPTMSVSVLESGVNYVLEATGTYVNTPHNVADAEYTSVDNWINQMDGYDISPWFLGEGEFDLKVNNGFVDWGPYNTGHVYTRDYVGTGDKAGFMIFDGDTDPYQLVPGWYGDNTGSLTVNIYAWM